LVLHARSCTRADLSTSATYCWDVAIGTKGQEARRC
jgi:hypothetical protein